MTTAKSMLVQPEAAGSLKRAPKGGIPYPFAAQCSSHNRVIGSAALKGDQTSADFTGFTVPFREKLFPEITFIELTMRVIEENG